MGPSKLLSRPFVILAGTIVLASGCSGNTDRENAELPDAGADAASAKAVDDLVACTLVTPADVEAVIGMPVRDSLALQMAQGQGTVALSQCNYASASNPAIVSVMLNQSPDGAFGSVAQDGVRGSLKESGVTIDEIQGLGEVAFWGGGQLHVFVNRNSYFIVSARDRQHAEALAQRALPRLR